MRGIERLGHFLAVADAGSFQAAAREINISQPALSRSIRLLEETLDIKLFERSSVGATLTSAGLAFLTRSREIAQVWDEALISLNAIRSGAVGELRLGVGPTYALLVVPEIVRGLAERFPNVRLNVEIGVASHLLPRVASGELACYLGAIDEVPMDGVDNVKQIELMVQRNVLVTSRDVTLPEEGGARLAALGNMRWIGLSYDKRYRAEVRRLFAAAGRKAPAFTVNSRSLRMTLDLVTQPGFVTGLPEPILRHPLSDRIKEISVAGYDWQVRTGMTYRHSLEALEPFQWLKETLLELPLTLSPATAPRRDPV